MIVLIELVVQTVYIVCALDVNRRAEFDELLVPRFDLADELTGVVALTRLAEQTVLLFYYLVVARESIQESRTAGDCSSIDEPAALTRIAADHVHLFERENEHGEIAQVT